MRTGIGLGLAVILAGCASRLTPREPGTGAQLWQEKQCFAHELPAWSNIDGRALAGVVRASYPSGEWALNDAIVYARPWPRGAVMEALTDAEGHFAFNTAGAGLYEVAACLPGFNPWRGTVRVDATAAAASVTLTVMLGQ
jgi:hypothetical protein